MKFKKETIEVLKNFALINPSIVFKPGKQLKTVKPTKTVFAVADIDEEVEGEFGIYKLNEFLNAIAMFENPEYTILDNRMRIHEGEREIQYVFAEPSLIVQPPEKEIKFPEADIKFSVDDKTLQSVMKAAATLGSTELVVSGDGEKIRLETVELKNTASNSFKQVVGQTSAKFKMVFKYDNVLLMGDKTYEVEISSKGLSRWTAEGIVYYIAVEKTSTFEG